MISRRRWWTNVLVLTLGPAVLLFVAAMIATDPGKNLGVVAVERRMRSDEFSRYDTTFVTVRNATGRAYGEVELRLTRTDEAGRVVSRVAVPVGELAPRTRKTFIVPDDTLPGLLAEVHSPENVRPAWIGGCDRVFCWPAGEG